MGKKPNKDRANTAQIILGERPKLFGNKLPTEAEVLLQVEFLILKQKYTNNNDAYKVTAQNLISNYESMNLDSRSFKAVFEKVKKLHSKYCTETKKYSVDKMINKSSLPVKSRRTKKYNLKSKYNLNFYENAQKSFSCGLKVSKNSISELDAEVNQETDNDDDNDSQMSDPDYYEVPKIKIKIKKPVINPTILADGDRYGKSNREIAREIARNTGKVYSVEGIRKARIRARNDAASSLSLSKPLAIGFDERKDKSRLAGSSHKFDKTEHCSVVLYDAEIEKYAGFFAPASGKARSVADGLIKFCNEKNVDLSNLVACVSDGCAKMSGHHGGVHVLMENEVKRPLLKIFCLFHASEKAFECYFKLKGGLTTGPTSLVAPWSNLLVGDIHERSVYVNFKVLPNNWLLETIDAMPEGLKLSKDHSILIGLSRVIITGNLTPVTSKTIGPLNNARFVTMETRCLRSYLSEDDPCQVLKDVVHYLIYVFVPTLLYSKMYYKVHFMGPKLLLLSTMLSKKYLKRSEHLEMVKSYSQNGFMAIHENILMCLIESPFIEERKLGVEMIEKIRTYESSENIRKIHPSDYQINPDATDLMNLNRKPLSMAQYEPPPTKGLSLAELRGIIEKPLNLGLPLSSVAIERAVKDTTRVALLAGSINEKNGAAMLTEMSRNTAY